MSTPKDELQALFFGAVAIIGLATVVALVILIILAIIASA